MVNDRVEAAEKIRGYGEWLDVYSYTSAAPKAIDRLRDTIIDTYDYAVLLDGLADLIDPITNVVIETNEDDDVEYIFCGGCGEEFSTDLFNEHEITHCPYCGCRFRNPR